MNAEHFLKYKILSGFRSYISKAELEILQDRDNENHAITLEKITRDVISDLPDNIPDMQDEKTAAYIRTAIQQTILWTADHEKERKTIEGQIYNEMAGHIIEKFRPRIISDTGEIIIYEKTHYIAGKNPELKIRAQIRDYDNIMTDSEITTIVNKVREKLDLIIERDALNKDNGISFENGYLNLDTLELAGHSPDHLNTVHIPARYEKGALPELQGDKEWTAADLDAAFEGVEYWTRLKECLPKFKDAYTLLEFLAYSLSKDLKLTRAVMHLGNGANGKSTFLEHWEHVIGPANAAHESIHELAENRFRRANLDGRLCNIYTDVEYDELKTGTGGIKLLIEGKRITAERKRQNPFDLQSFATLMFSANSLPPIKDQSDGFFRRQIIIKWEQEIENEDPNLKNRLINDKPGNTVLFGILLQIRKRLYARGHFMQDKGPEYSRKMWNENTDHIERFVSECTKRALIKDYETKDDTYDSYLKYCEKRRIIAYRRKTFARHFSDHYDEGTKWLDDENSVKVWRAMQLIKDDDKDE